MTFPITGKRVDLELSEIEARLVLEVLQAVLSGEAVDFKLRPDKRTGLVRGRDRLMSSLAALELSRREPRSR